MINAIFLSDTDTSELIGRAYNDQALKTINRFAIVYPEVISRDLMKEKSDILRNADVLFSTWGMPKLSEREITYYLPKLKCVFYAGGSVQKFARSFLIRNIRVISAWAANAIDCVDLTTSSALNPSFDNSV